MEQTFQFVNRDTGEVIESTSQEMRVGRMRRRVAAWGKAATMPGDMIMITATYRYIGAWRPRHMSDLMRHIRRHLGNRLQGYMWVAELQKRGAVHYHILLKVTHGSRIPMPDKVGWWPYGMTRIELVRNVQSAGAYVRKYMSKGDNDMPFPPGLRLYAVVIRKFLSSEAWQLRWWSTPAWLRVLVTEAAQVVGVGDPVRKVTGGWIIGDIWYRSPWAYIRPLPRVG